jgi:hypothetical protein
MWSRIHWGAWSLSVAVAVSGAAGGAESRDALRLPDATLTPGAIASADARVVCARGYARKRRPPYRARWWREIDDRVRREYGVPSRGAARRAWILDHDVAVELGGAPADRRNLWPQLRREATLKDRVEDALHQAVCAGRMPLARAQREIMADWRRTSVGDPYRLPATSFEKDP